MSVECTPENYVKLLEENKLLKRQLAAACKPDCAPTERVVCSPGKRRLYGRNKDGVYEIDGNIYGTLTGSRTDVCDGKSYRTSGGLTKSYFIINKSGKIVSRRKSIEETRSKGEIPPMTPSTVGLI